MTKFVLVKERPNCAFDQDSYLLAYNVSSVPAGFQVPLLDTRTGKPLIVLFYRNTPTENDILADAKQQLRFKSVTPYAPDKKGEGTVPMAWGWWLELHQSRQGLTVIGPVYYHGKETLQDTPTLSFEGPYSSEAEALEAIEDFRYFYQHYNPAYKPAACTIHWVNSGVKVYLRFSPSIWYVESDHSESLRIVTNPGLITQLEEHFQGYQHARIT